ncbi:MAG TPA: hypothetical protein VMX75_10935 [Spirochaetia bacterium]|nr:hypothetical protein [Spirochaetia bacterium]
MDSRHVDNLDSFDPLVRRKALEVLIGEGEEFPPDGFNLNMHFHSFFSYNASGYSPAHITWEARKAGLYAVALCDFDVLDGLDEFHESALSLALRACVHLETRTFIPELSEAEINSPGEPGVAYFMGAGFAQNLREDSEQNRRLGTFREQAQKRNEELVRRINIRIPEVALDYRSDVLPLTPSGNATERHIIGAYVDRVRKVFPGEGKRIPFWMDLLKKGKGEVEELEKSRASLEEAVRARLIKGGGIGYKQPGTDTFPKVDGFIAWVLSCEAIPMFAWLDGTSRGEADPAALLEMLVSKGTRAVNIIPDRNWNVRDPGLRAVKRENLQSLVQTADRMHLPVNIGTEMNKPGLPFVDDLNGESLRPFRETFIRGARIMVGHCLLLRYAGFSYAGKKVEAEMGRVSERNRFFGSVGALPPLSRSSAERLREAGAERAFVLIQDSVRRGRWAV